MIFRSPFPKVLPSVLNVPNNDVQAAVNNTAEFVDGIHYDVMDGKFVPPTTFTAEDFRSLDIPVFTDIHLMVNDVEHWVEEFGRTSANLLTFHYEAEQKDVRKTIELIKSQKKLAGLAIKPQTLVENIPKELWDLVDIALIMSVEPGWGGQSFIEEVLEKVKYLRQRYDSLPINIDGGINDVTAKKACSAGCTHLVSGSYIFKSKDYKSTIESLRYS